MKRTCSGVKTSDYVVIQVVQGHDTDSVREQYVVLKPNIQYRLFSMRIAVSIPERLIAPLKISVP
jgi:hypothetical protein